MKTDYIQFLGKPVTCYQFGDPFNPAILFIHGNSAHAGFFNPLIHLLENRYFIVTPDLPGHRHSEQWELEEYTRENFALLFNNLLDYYKISTADAFGFSMGGLILLECLDKMPAIRRIAVAGHPPLTAVSDMSKAYYLNEDSSLYLQGTLTDAEAERVYNAVIGIENEQIKNELKNALLETNPVFREGCLAMAQNVSDQVSKLNQLHNPVAIIHAADDKAVQFNYLEKLTVSKLWEEKIHLIHGSGHHVILEKPDELALLLDRFFRSEV